MKKVKSSNVDGYKYDAATQVLTVRFKNGGTYHYHGVDQKKVDQLEQAESFGSHLHHHVKPHHECKREGDE